MAETLEGETTQPSAVVLSPTRERSRIVVESSIAIMDTAKFEHLGRIATLMADACLMPESLTHEGPKDKREMLPEHIIKARAFLICAQAERWNMDPLAVMGCCSLVHNKLMYEGKLVYGVLEARLGVRLNFEFGQWDPLSMRVMINTEPKDKTLELLGVVVSGTLPGEATPRSIEGFVALWKTTGANSPWTNPGHWKRQLRYRGTRDWAAAYSPGLILGVVTDDDLDDIEARAEATIHQAPKLDDAFGGKKAPAKRVEAPKTTAAEVAHALHTGDGQVEVDQNTGEVTEVRKGESAQAAETGKATPASATAASTASAAATSGQQKPVQPSGAGQKDDARAPFMKTMEGHARPGVGYHFADTPIDADGNWTIYTDGVATGKVLAKERRPVYAEHAPKVKRARAVEISEGLPLAGETYHLAPVEAADEHWHTFKDGKRIGDLPAFSARVYSNHPEGVADGGDQGEETSKSQASSDASREETEPGYDVAAFNGYGQKIGALDSWLTIRKEVYAIRGAEFFRDAPADVQRMALLVAYNRTVDINDPVRPWEDPAFYRLWLLQAEPTAVDDVFGRLMRSPAGTKLMKEAADLWEIVANETAEALGQG